MTLDTRTTNLVGKHFGQWLVIEFDSYHKRNAFWVCECTCGKFKTVSAQSLLNGTSTKCRQCALHTYKVLNYFPESFWKTLTYNAKKRDIPFLLSREEAFQLLRDQQFYCRLSGVSIYMSRTATEHLNGLTTASVDCINPKLGYSLQNVQWVHKDVNFMKGTLSQEKFLVWCDQITNYQDRFRVNIL